MRILVVDCECCALDFVLRASEQGHDVKWYFQSKRPLRLGEGFTGFKMLEKLDAEAFKWVGKEGLVFATGNSKYQEILDYYRSFGWKVFAPSKKSAELEIDRGKGQKLIESLGFDVPKYEMFDSLELAEKYVKKMDKPFVFKTMGDNDNKALSYVASDPVDLLNWIHKKKLADLNLKGKCMLQEKIDLIAEYALTAWCTPEGYLPDLWDVSFEHKKLFPGEIGPNTGEQGTVCKYVTEDPLIEYLKALEPTMVALGHCTDIDLSGGIDSKGKFWPFEFTARLGWPAFFLHVERHKGDVAQWMLDACKGIKSLKVSDDVGICVVLAQPQYPYFNSPTALVEGNVISGLDKVWDNFHPSDIRIGKGFKRNDSGNIVEGRVHQTSGEYVGVVTDQGKTVSDAKEKVYKKVDKIKFSNMMYRNDIGDKVIKQLSGIQKFGYAQGFKE